MLFKVDGVSSSAPVYNAVTVIMLLLCATFIVAWLAVAAVSVARQAESTTLLSLTRWIARRRSVPAPTTKPMSRGNRVKTMPSLGLDDASLQVQPGDDTRPLPGFTTENPLRG